VTKARGVKDHPVLTAARRERLTAARTGFDMGIPFNELNRVFDLGFKPLPWGDHPYIPTTMQPADTPGSAGVPRASPNGAAYIRWHGYWRVSETALHLKL
jgi:hypothetical protein